MTVHYHGTPITPREVILSLAGRCFCVRYGAAGDLEVSHRIGQSVMLDNGAFTFWRKGQNATAEWWEDYYRWVEPWLDYPTTWAVIPDVIDGDEAANDHLLSLWPHGDRGAPVWHMDESIDRLLRLCDAWPRVCIGSSGRYEDLNSPQWSRRMDEAMNALCGNGPVPVWLHMLRGMAKSDSGYPFASVDSTDIARNHNRPRNTAARMAARWDAKQAPARWEIRAHTPELEITQ